jgi:hypothetical protein
VVEVRLVAAFEAPSKVAALVDSGSEHTLAAPWLARAIGAQLDAYRTAAIGIGGSSRAITFADVTLLLSRPPGSTTDGEFVEWQAEVGFFTAWEPAWAVLLGQVGFFDQFTVTLQRQAQALAVEPAEVFDDRFGVLIRESDERRRRGPV